MKEKLMNLGIVLILFGIVTFFFRPVFFSCSVEQDLCKIYKTLEPAKTFKYSFVEDCTPSDMVETYHGSLEYDKERALRKMGNYNYQKKTKSVTRHYPNIIFKDFIDDTYNVNTLKLDRIQGFSSSDIAGVCNDIKNHQSFVFKSNPYLHDMFSYWYVSLIIGVVMLLIFRI